MNPLDIMDAAMEAERCLYNIEGATNLANDYRLWRKDSVVFVGNFRSCQSFIRRQALRAGLRAISSDLRMINLMHDAYNKSAANPRGFDPIMAALLALAEGEG